MHESKPSIETKAAANELRCRLLIFDLDAFSRGAAFLGCGGGGDPYINGLIAARIFEHHGFPTIVDPIELPASDMIVCFAGMESPLVQQEVFNDLESAHAAIKALRTVLGGDIAALAPIEIGGGNALLPLILGSVTGLPVLDADGMGRAFPELPMTSFTAMGRSATPAAIVADGISRVFHEMDVKQLETECRAIAVEHGGRAYLAFHPQSAAGFADSCIPNTLSLAQKIGQNLASCRSMGDLSGSWNTRFGLNVDDPFYLKLSIEAKVLDRFRTTTTGFLEGICRADADGMPIEIQFKNEYLRVCAKNKIIGETPEMITLVDTETRRPILSNELKYGQRITLLVLNSVHQFRTPSGLALVGPDALGLSTKTIRI